MSLLATVMACACFTCFGGACNSNIHGKNARIRSRLRWARLSWFEVVLAHLLGWWEKVGHFWPFSSKHHIGECLWSWEKNILSDGWFKFFHEFVQCLSVCDHSWSKLQTKIPMCFGILLHRPTLYQMIKLVLQTTLTIQIRKLTVQLNKQWVQIQILQIATSCLTPIHPPSQSFPFKQGYSKPCLIITIHQTSSVTIFPNLKLPLQ